MTIKLADASKAAERNVARLVEHAERFDPGYRVAFFTRIAHQLEPILSQAEKELRLSNLEDTPLKPGDYEDSTPRVKRRGR